MLLHLQKKFQLPLLGWFFPKMGYVTKIGPYLKTCFSQNFRPPHQKFFFSRTAGVFGPPAERDVFLDVWEHFGWVWVGSIIFFFPGFFPVYGRFGPSHRMKWPFFGISEKNSFLKHASRSGWNKKKFSPKILDMASFNVFYIYIIFFLGLRCISGRKSEF